MMIPSDLMLEQLETAEMPLPQGIRQYKEHLKHCTVTEVKVTDEEGAAALGRRVGRYITVETEKNYEIGEPAFEEISDCLALRLRQFLKNKKRILVLGIGNPSITPDSLGSKTVERILVSEEIAAMSPPVYGQSGIEGATVAKGLAKYYCPEAIVLVDALATARPERLCRTVQLAETGLTPGGGVGNPRKEIDLDTVGVPVLSVGIPTVLDLRALLRHVSEDWENLSQKLSPFEESLVATPRQMEAATDMGARIIAFALNKAFYPQLTTEDILKYLY